MVNPTNIQIFCTKYKSQSVWFGSSTAILMHDLFLNLRTYPSITVIFGKNWDTSSTFLMSIVTTTHIMLFVVMLAE